MLKYLFGTLLIAVLVILAVALGAGLLVLLAYAVGWGLTQFLPFSLFEATLMSLVGVAGMAYVAGRLLVSIFSDSSFVDVDDEEDFDEEDFYDEEEEEEDLYPGIPRWRQPRRELDFSNVGPEDRCPCGSGRKYKNCHGGWLKRKREKSSS